MLPSRSGDPLIQKTASLTGGNNLDMATTIRLDETTAAALRRRAVPEHRSMKDIAAQAIREYTEQRVRADWLGQVTDELLVRYRGALNRLGK
jgi:hypothetical protein